MYKKITIRKKMIGFILVLSFMLSICFVKSAMAAENTELNIYAMYLEANEKGDSVLLESKGHYLLIDIGTAAHMPAIIKQLNTLGANHVDIMFSHLHSDHIGASSTSITAGLEQLSAAGITVDTLYLPDKNLALRSQIYPYRYTMLESFMAIQGKGKIVYLKTGDRLKVGDADGRIVGPLNTWKLSPDQYTQYDSEKERSITYENNCSLAAIFTCGNTSYFTAGDIYEDGANSLVEHYGYSISCDIMKLSHHGIGSGNPASLIRILQPSYSFVPNTGIATNNKTTGRWRAYPAIKNSSKYGLCYLVGSEKKTLIYRIVNDKITLYQGDSTENGVKMTGWQYLYGADGYYRDHDMYYLNSDCKPVKGIQKIGDHFYNFVGGGQMDYGQFSEEREYLGWKSDETGERYYKLSPDKKYAYMAHGFEKIGSSLLYFNEDGYKVVNETSMPVALEKIGVSYYAVGSEGRLTINNWEKINGSLYYFDKAGKMIRKQLYKVNGQYYLFGSDGALLTSKSGTKLYKLGSETYAVRKDATVVINKIITINKKKFYFGKDGKMVCGKKFKLNGKTYSSSAKGVVTEVKKK